MSDRAREGLFSSLGQDVPGARCVDLYAGSGAIGIEALSRGAASCVFVDRARDAAEVIEANLRRTHLSDRAEVVRAEVEAYLQGTVGPFDLAFCDPPFDLEAATLRRVLESLRAAMAKGGTIVVSRRSGTDTDVIPVHFREDKRLAYGDTVVLVGREES